LFCYVYRICNNPSFRSWCMFSVQNNVDVSYPPGVPAPVTIFFIRIAMTSSGYLSRCVALALGDSLKIRTSIPRCRALCRRHNLSSYCGVSVFWGNISFWACVCGGSEERVGSIRISLLPFWILRAINHRKPIPIGALRRALIAASSIFLLRFSRESHNVVMTFNSGGGVMDTTTSSRNRKIACDRRLLWKRMQSERISPFFVDDIITSGSCTSKIIS